MRFSPGKAIGVMLMSLGVSLAVANERETICAHAKLQGAAAYARCLVRVTQHTKWPSRAGAIDSTTRCENAKLQAAGTYAECLVQAAKRANLKGDELTDARIEHCDEQFDRAFERAEADESCRTAGGPATLRGAIRGQLEETFGLATTAGGCASTPSFDQDTLSYTCTLTSGSAVDLSAIIEQINDAQVTADTVVWIEAWGGGGGPGNTSNGGSGAAGGYAQVTTTVDDMMRFLENVRHLLLPRGQRRRARGQRRRRWWHGYGRDYQRSDGTNTRFLRYAARGRRRWRWRWRTGNIERLLLERHLE